MSSFTEGDDDWLGPEPSRASAGAASSGAGGKKKKGAKKGKKKGSKTPSTHDEQPQPALADEGIDDYDDPKWCVSARDTRANVEEQRYVHSLVAHKAQQNSARTYWKREQHLIAPMDFVQESDLDKCGPIYDPRVPRLKEQWGWMEKDEEVDLPAEFEWAQLALHEECAMNEVCELLKGHYVSDDVFWRFNLSKASLKWALLPPGYHAYWHVGIRAKSTGQLVALITGTPCTMRVHTHVLSNIIINFLCVHRDVRASGLAPKLITEITRRSGQKGVYQAVYTLNDLKSRPVSVAQWWHRSLNVKKLVDVRWIQLNPRETLQRNMKKYALPERTKYPLTRLTLEDCASAHTLLKRYLKEMRLARQFSSEEFIHNFVPRDGVVDTYILKDATGAVSDLMSFFFCDTTLLRKPKGHEGMKIAYSHYNVVSTADAEQFIIDAMVIARNSGCDVYNMLDVMDNANLFDALKFDVGDGKMHYHIYNWVCPSILSRDVGLVLI